MQGATTVPPAAATGVDLISQFNDDVLLHILGFLPAARDVARTTVLSTRWRHLWSIVPCLRFAIGDGVDGDNGDRDAHAARLLIAAVDATVARRADVDILEISFDYGSSRQWSFYEQPCAADIMSSHSRAAAWLRFAGRHVRRTFAVDLPPLGWRRDRQAAAVVTAGDLAELPRTARVETMRLQLGNATLTLPVPGAVGAGSYSALTDFHLHQATLAGAGANNLGHLLSSSCSPRLRRLGLTFVDGLVELRLDAAGTLEELELVVLPDLRLLDVGAPGLRLLRIDLFDMNYHDPTPVRISAPRLEALACDDMLSPAQLQFDGAAAVRHIKNLAFYFYYPVDDVLNATTVWLLKNCTAMDHLELDLVIDMPYTENEWPIGEDIMDDVPELPSVTNLAISIHVQLGGHTIGATLTKFIAKCRNVEYISIGFNELKNMRCSDSSCFCRQPEGWEDQKISLEHLRAVDIRDFTPSDDWICLVQLLLANSPVLETMTVELDKISLKEIQKEGKSVQFDVPCSKGFWAYVSSQSDEHGFNSVVKYKWTLGI
uniref:F-box domain-containing protein n=1 Tax=Oryza punctata TaxID=4537 RepID=A0A0E0MN18_ORYPU